MTTITTHGEIGQDRKLRVAVDCDLPPGEVQVVLMVQHRNGTTGPSPTWEELWGLGREVWHGIDASRYVSEQREDREPMR